MTAYLPTNWLLLPVLLAAGGTIFTLGWCLQRRPVLALDVVLAWMMTVAAVAGIEQFTRQEPPGVRMVAIIVALLWSMKLVVLTSSRLDGGANLPPGRWFGFLFGWPGMQPSIFAKPLRSNPGATRRLATRGLVRSAAGLGFLLLARSLISSTEELPWGTVRSSCATLLLLIGVSLSLHFGMFNLIAAGWQAIGVNCQPLFRAPLASSSLSEFWSRRWNLAFSEMTALAVFRPCHRWLGTSSALLIGFAFSGLAHELAITVPIQSHYGMPSAYFLFHGVMVMLERRFDLPRHCGNWYRGCVLICIAAPLPILFPPAFLREIVWPLAGCS